MEIATYNDVLDILGKYDKEAVYSEPPPSTEKELAGELAKYFEQRETIRAVVGIDIYRYSRFDLPRQRLIPILFQYLYESAVKACHKLDAALFSGCDLRPAFIPTGDGGFQIHDNPLQALAFTVWFQVFIDSYNAGMHFPNLRKIVGPLMLRYSLTLDTVMQLDTNFFGPAIITNARILSRDSLNRFLLDGKTVEWFTERFGSIENLSVTTFDDVAKAPGALVVDKDKRSVLFRLGRKGEARETESAFRMVVVQKLGDVSAKQTPLDVYNCYLQVSLTRASNDETYQKPMVVTVGNLHASGIAA